MTHTFMFNIEPANWLNSNQRLDRHEKARRNATIRDTARYLLRSAIPARGTIPTPARVTATVHTPSNRRFDPPNAWPTIKPLLDAYTLEQLIPDDDDKHIPETLFIRGNNTGTGSYHIRLTFDPLPITDAVTETNGRRKWTGP